MSADRAALSRALAKGLFARAFKQAVTAPDSFIDDIEKGLERRTLDALGLARRTGEAVVGFDQVKEALAKGKAEILISAADAADDGREKLARLGKGVFQHTRFLSAALSDALGKEGVKHAALLRGAAAKRFKREAERLEGVSAPAV